MIYVNGDKLSCGKLSKINKKIVQKVVDTSTMTTYNRDSS